jgi:tetratricopeptide (TPR) repeat protein
LDLADATVAFRHALPVDRERLVFERLAVFADRFTCEAVTAVCGAGLTEAEVLDLLTTLIAKSLIVRHDDGSPPALYRLLHSVRRYADERFAEHLDQESVRHRHAQYWSELAQRDAPPLNGPDRSDWLTLVDLQIANITQAIEWSIEHSPELALRTIAAIGRWFCVRAHYSEARAWSQRGLQASNHAPDAVEVFVLELAGTCAFLQNDYEDAESIIRAARDLFVGMGDQDGLIRTTGRLGAIARGRDRYEEAESWHRQALQLSEHARDDNEVATQLSELSILGRLRGGPQFVRSVGPNAVEKMRVARDREGLIWSLISLGMAARESGDLVVADQLLHHCLDLAEELPFRKGVAWATNQLGITSRLRQDLAAAKRWQQLSLTEHRRLGDRWRQASVYDELATVAVAEDDGAGAARYLALADGLRSGLGAPGPVIEHAQRAETRTAADHALGVDYGPADLTGGPPAA